MSRKKVSELDIVDSLLGDASNDVKARVAESVDADPETAEIHDQWRSILHAVRTDAGARKVARQRAIEHAMQRIRLEGLRPDADVSRKLDWDALTSIFEKFRSASWRKLGVASAVALLAVTCVGFLLQWTASPGIDVGAMQASNGKKVVETEGVGAGEWYVDFQFDGPELGTASGPFRTVGHGITGADAGGILYIFTGSSPETFITDKPITLVAVNGSVRIGS